MQSESSPSSLRADESTRKGSLWRVGFVIMAIVFGPALVAWILMLVNHSR